MRGPRNGCGEKRPRVRRARRGASRVRFASAVKTRGSRLPLRCLASSLAPIDKNAELLRVPCGARGYPPGGTINMPVQVEKLASAIGPGFDLERNQAESPPRDGRRNPGPRIIYRLRCSADGKARLTSWQGRSIASTILTAPDGPISASQAPRRGKSCPRRRMLNEQPTIR
jgi:hypothetical protein